MKEKIEDSQKEKVESESTEMKKIKIGDEKSNNFNNQDSNGK